MKLASKEAIDLQEDYEGKKAEALISYGWKHLIQD